MNKKLCEEIKEIIKKEKLDIDINQNEEKIIKEFQDKINWNYISANQKLSESFIREFQDKISWYWISKYQKLSESFIKEFKNKIDWNWINENKKIIKTEKLQNMINQEILIQELK